MPEHQRFTGPAIVFAGDSAGDDGQFYPAQVSADGDLLVPATDLDHPEVIDDAVDGPIERVLRRGGWVALMADGALGAHKRVALTLNSER